MGHSEFFTLFNDYWWLLFPLAWGISAMVWTWMRHKRALRALELIASYADHGKEPPPELLKYLQPIQKPKRRWQVQRHHFMWAGFFIAVLAIAFAGLAWLKRQDGQYDPGLLFVVLLFGGFSAASFLSALVSPRIPDQIDTSD